MNPFQEIINAKEEYDRKVKEFGKEKFQGMMQGFFEQHPGVRAFRWSQYTPSFNDGDPCRFTVREPDLMMTEEFIKTHQVMASYIDEEEFTDDEGWFEEGAPWGLKEKDEDAYNAMIAASGHIRDFLSIEDVLETVFGESVQVTVTREGIEIDGYNCGY